LSNEDASSETIKSSKRHQKIIARYVLTSGVGAEPRQKLKTNVSLAVHGACMDLENLGAALKVR
jgi:hypothetical protein